MSATLENFNSSSANGDVSEKTVHAEKSSPTTRNVQTQHGDYQITDEGNIFLIAACLWPKATEIVKESIVQPEETDVTDSSETHQTVWIEPFANGNSSVEVVENIESNKLSEKRKASDEPEAEIAAKKPKRGGRQIIRPGFSEERYDETSYYIQNGLRKVYPYYFTFTTYTKGRWVGETVLDIFSREFRAQSADVYEKCIQNGTLTVNNVAVPTDYKLKQNDLLANIVHRHEVPVLNKPIQIIHIDDDVVVINKPSSIPVHPCGRYRHNTAVFILARDYGLKDLRTMHRLDRLTSGLLLFGRNVQKARQTEQQIRTRLVQKEYVCRVDGEFPDGLIESNEPIEVVSYKIGVCRVSQNGKECKTTFEKLSFNGQTSVVLCRPRTGRMHQIRVHLQYLGYPISNDPLYNHTAFGPLKGRGGDIGGKTNEQLVNDLAEIHNAENWLGAENDDDGCCGVPSDADTKTNSSDSTESSIGDCENFASTETEMNPNELKCSTNQSVATQTSYEVPNNHFDASKITTDENCVECRMNYRDPKPKDLVMYLHALKYSGPGWSYETPLPEWANENYIDKLDA